MEFYLTAGAVYQPGAKLRLAGNLPHQIHLETVVDGDHVIVSGNVGYINHIVRAVQSKHGVFMGELDIIPAAALKSGEHSLAGVQGGLFAGNDTPLNELSHSRATHLRVYGQV